MIQCAVVPPRECSNVSEPVRVSDRNAVECPPGHIKTLRRECLRLLHNLREVSDVSALLSYSTCEYVPLYT